MGYEKFILDCDRLGMMHRLLEGLALDDNAMAADAFHEAGPGHHFLGTAHTLKNYETAYYEARTSDANSFEQWRDQGEKTAEARAFEQYQALLRSYEPPPIDEGIDEALRDFIAHRKDAVPDAWH
jgi:trimethylamine--corrinoid protein Co-methyltransferase